MIDLHSHVLPNVDDGAKDLKESIELILLAQKLGYKKICCTSHYICGMFENENYDNSLKKLREQLKIEKIDMEVLEGNELFLDSDGFKALKEKKVKTLNNTDYILIEIIPNMNEKLVKRDLKKVMKLGYKPILAHIERYPFIDLKFLYKLKKMGILTQVNLKGLKNNDTLYNWIELGLIDVVTSDTHNIKYRSYDVEDILNEIDNKLGVKIKEKLLIKNPKKIINNEEILETIDEEKINNLLSQNSLIKHFFNT